jgi:hypothetical protein
MPQSADAQATAPASLAPSTGRSIYAILELTSAVGAVALVLAALALKLNLDALKPGLFKVIDLVDIVSISFNTLFTIAPWLLITVPLIWLAAMVAERLLVRLRHRLLNRVANIVLTALLASCLAWLVGQLSGAITGWSHLLSVGSLVIIGLLTILAVALQYFRPDSTTQRTKRIHVVLLLVGILGAVSYFSRLKDTLEFSEMYLPAQTTLSGQKLCTTVLQSDPARRNFAVVFVGANTLIVECDGQGNYDIIKNPSGLIVAVR